MVWAVVFFVVILPLAAAVTVALLPEDDDRRPWRLTLADRLEAFAVRLRGNPQPTPDPFAALRVQERLGVVAQHVQRLEADRRVIARAEKIVASQLAYDYLLAEACAMAGVDIPPHATGDPVERFREEVELAARGWTW